jgi:hypothetical protein
VFKQLIPSLIAGAVIAGLALLSGLVGMVLAMRRKPQSTAEVIVSLSGTVLGLFFLCSFALYATLAKKASDALPAEMPVAKQILGTEEAKKVPMVCRACGHEFELDAVDLVSGQVSKMANVLAAVGDTDKLLDQVEKEAETGSVCPNCKKARAFPKKAVGATELGPLQDLMKQLEQNNGKTDP